MSASGCAVRTCFKPSMARMLVTWTREHRTGPEESMSIRGSARKTHTNDRPVSTLADAACLRLTCPLEHRRTPVSAKHASPSSIPSPSAPTIYLSYTTYNHMITPRFSQHIRDELRGNRCTRFVLLVLSGVKEVWNDCGDSSGRSDLCQSLSAECVI